MSGGRKSGAPNLRRAGNRAASQRGSTPTRRGGRRPGGRAGERTGADRRNRHLGGEKVVGRQSVKELLLAGRRPVREVLLASDLEPARILEEIIDLADEAGVKIHETPRKKIETLAETASHQGVLALTAPLPTYSLEDALAHRDVPTGNRAPPLLLLDGVDDPGNLGSLLRTAECAGVRVVVLARHRSARITPIVTKRAAGATEHLFFVPVSGIPSALSELAERGVWSIGLDAAAKDSIWELNLADAPAALVLGSEGRGLSRLTRKRCDLLVRIPTEGRLGVLNVTVAGAAALFEFARRRMER